MRIAVAAALLLLCGAGAVHAELVDWSYTWGRSTFGVPANSGTRVGAVNIILPGDGAASPPVEPVALRAFTALNNGNDRYNAVDYSLTFAITDADTGRSHVLTVQGEFTGTVTSNRVSLRNAFTGGSGFQTFDFLGADPNGSASGPWCWLLRDPRPLAQPIKAKGAASLWAWK